MAKPVDVAVLDPELRRLVERGVKEAFGVSLTRLLAAFGGESNEDDLETLVLVGRLAEEADRRDGCDAGPHGSKPTTPLPAGGDALARPDFAAPKRQTVVAGGVPPEASAGEHNRPVDVAGLDMETRRLVERGVREAFGRSFDEFLDDAKIGGVDLTEEDIEGLRLAGELAGRADRRDTGTSG
jgi:hypothetical protein